MEHTDYLVQAAGQEVTVEAKSLNAHRAMTCSLVGWPEPMLLSLANWKASAFADRLSAAIRWSGKRYSGQRGQDDHGEQEIGDRSQHAD